MEHRLPNEILEKRKTGFASPIVQWFRGSLRSFVEEELSDENVKRRGYFNPKVVKNILNEHFQKRRNLQRQIFVLLTFEVWHRIYIGD
jgi:asparagine synthase (glutamine-hydrolysing)